MECFKFYFSLCIYSSFFVIVVVIVKVEFGVESVEMMLSQLVFYRGKEFG